MVERAHEVIVVGAGAAGLWAAARAAQLGRQVLLLEKTPRVGTKVLASGGTRCNLTTTLGPEEAGRLFGPRAERFLRQALRALPPLELRRHFAEFGVETVEAPLEKVFPRSGRARDVRDALLRSALDSGVSVACNRPVVGLEPVAEGWRVRVADGGSLAGRHLLLCPGGKSYPRTGTTGEGYAWLEGLGLALAAPVPALVPLTSPEPWVRALAGVSLQIVHVRLVDAGGKLLGERERPVVFTHRGVSGPGAMDLSEHVAHEVNARGTNLPRAACPELRLDLLPELERPELRTFLIEAARLPGAPSLQSALSRLLPRPIPKRLLAAVARQAGLADENPRVIDLARGERHELIEAAKGLRIPIDGTLGFDQAEVTAGGLDLGEVDPGTMAVRAHPGLHVFGELLDVAGPIGGLNFQAAFATAELAARAVGGDT